MSVQNPTMHLIPVSPDIILCIEVLTLDLGLPVIGDIVIFVVAAFTATRGF
jgi:hypothetical protein